VLFCLPINRVGVFVGTSFFLPLNMAMSSRDASQEAAAGNGGTAEGEKTTRGLQVWGLKFCQKVWWMTVFWRVWTSYTLNMFNITWK